MLNPDFTFALEEFTDLESQIQFYAPLDVVSAALSGGYMKWEINGLGEAYGFLLRLKSNQRPFVVKTMVNVNAVDGSDPIEWFIETKNLDTALEVFKGLKLNSVEISWRKGAV